MKIRLVSAVVIALALGMGAYAQDENPAQTPGAGRGGYGQRGGRGMGAGNGAGMGMMGAGRGVMGTVTQVAADHFTVKTYTGETYAVHFSVNTRFVKQAVGQRGGGMGMGAGAGRGGGGRGMGAGGGRGAGAGDAANLPQPIKPTDIKPGDDIAAMGEVDPAAKSIGAMLIAQVDPERARQMHEMQANYGKTWIMGKVTAIDGVKVTLMGAVDNAPHSFVADENTTFRKRRDPITLADIQVGDTLRAEGALKDGTFTATTVNVMGMPQGGTPTVPRNAPPQ